MAAYLLISSRTVCMLGAVKMLGLRRLVISKVFVGGAGVTSGGRPERSM